MSELVVIDGSMGEDGGQILRSALALAMARGGAFITPPLSRHATTNIEVIRKFLDVSVDVQRRKTGLAW